MDYRQKRGDFPMKLITIIIFALLTASCTISEPEIMSAKAICWDNDGLKSIKFNMHIIAQCHNGAIFYM